MPEMKPFIARLDTEVLPGRQSRGRHNPSLSAGAKSGHLLCVNIDTVWQGSPLIEGRQWIAEETGTPDLNINFSCFLAPWSSRALHMPKLGTKQPALVNIHSDDILLIFFALTNINNEVLPCSLPRRWPRCR